MKINKNRYEILLQVAACGNISQAAFRLNYTQSGVSHVIAGLEKELNIQFFIRGKNGVRLTDKGKRLLPYIQDLVNRENNLQHAVYEMNNSLKGVLRIGSFSSASAFWLPEIIKYFQERYPEVEIEILDGNYTEIIEWINKGQVDCGFLSDLVADDLQFYPLKEDPIYAVVAKEHPLAGAKEVELAQALAYPLISETPGCDSDIQALLSQSGISPNICYSFRDDAIIFAFVEANLGITISQELVLNAFNAFGSKLCAVPLAGAPKRVIGLARKATMNSLLCDVFLEYMQKRRD